MEQMERKVFAVNRVIELFKEDGIMISEEQARKILELSGKLVNIVVTQCRKDSNAVESSTKHKEVS